MKYFSEKGGKEKKTMISQWWGHYQFVHISMDMMCQKASWNGFIDFLKKFFHQVI